MDALNPFSIAALVYLLSTDRPLGLCLTFAADTFVTYRLVERLTHLSWHLSGGIAIGGTHDGVMRES